MKRTRLLLFAGTTEGRELAAALDKPEFDWLERTICVATEYGSAVLPPMRRAQVRQGRLDAAALRAVLAEQDAVLDATHPYAVQISALLRTLCAEQGIRLLRCTRAPGDLTGCTVVADAADAARTAAAWPGNILLTTGAKELPAFAALPRERLFVRVLPCTESIAACEQAGIPRSHILALQGPFGAALERALLDWYDIATVVTKDGGTAGGFAAKKQAALARGAAVICIARPPEPEGLTVSEILREVQRWK